MKKETPLILIVDDDDDLRDILSTELTKEGYRIEDLPSAKHAMEWLSQNRPNLIILDVMMPDGNGLDLCRWIRSRTELHKVPIIINSGIKDNETMQMALKLGAMDFIRKPYVLSKLRETLYRWLNNPDAIRNLNEF